MIKKLLPFFFIFLGIFGYNSINAQDIHFSQFYMSPLNLNPALTGVMDCNVRLVGNYRNQWASVLGSNAFNTYSASYDQKFTVGREDYFGAGLTLWGDVAGEADFQTLEAKLSGSYSKKLGGSRTSAHFLALGAAAGFAQRSIDFLKLRFGTQHDGAGGFNPNAPSGEIFGDDSFTFFDVEAGLLWFSSFDRYNSAYLGAAFSHMNNPNVSFFDTTRTVELYSKLTIHGGGEISFNESIGLVPGAVMLIQGPSFELNAGTSLRFNLSNRAYNDQSFQIGVWGRLVNNAEFVETEPDPVEENTSLGMDAIILSTRFDYQNFGIGFSYDINVSELKPASNGNGAFEFSLIYVICNQERRGVYCPKF